MKSKIPILPLCLFLLLLGCLPCTAEKVLVDGEFQRGAGRTVQRGDYRGPSRSTVAIIFTNGLSAQVLHNLGNSYAASGKKGLAVLNLLRALRLSPGDEDIKGDLATMRKEMGLFTEVEGFIEKFVNLFDFNQWLFRVLVCYIILTILLLLYLFLSRSKWLLSGTSLILTALVLCLFGTWQQSSIWNSGVIVTPQTNSCYLPLQHPASLGNIAEGSIAVLRKHIKIISISMTEKVGESRLGDKTAI